MLLRVYYRLFFYQSNEFLREIKALPNRRGTNFRPLFLWYLVCDRTTTGLDVLRQVEGSDGGRRCGESAHADTPTYSIYSSVLAFCCTRLDRLQRVSCRVFVCLLSLPQACALAVLCCAAVVMRSESTWKTSLLQWPVARQWVALSVVRDIFVCITVI